MLAENDGRTWLLWQGKRSPVDLNNRAVTDALGFGAEPATPRPIATGLFNTVPESPALAPPPIPGAGEPPRFPLPVPAPVGAVVVAFDTDNTMRHFAVLPDGLQPVPPVLAEIMRNTNSYGLDQPPRLAADEVSRMPSRTSSTRPSFPATPLPSSTRQAPLSCARSGLGPTAQASAS